MEQNDIQEQVEEVEVEVKVKKGRPRKNIEPTEPKEPKPIGRPKKHQKN